MNAAATAASALRDSLASRFAVSTTRIPLGDGEVALSHPSSFDDLISEADYVRDERLPYWADLWPAARVLAERVRAEPGAGRRLLELGCGMGLVSTAAALAGFDVTATDYYPDACEFAQSNAWQNAHRAIETRHIDWRSLPGNLGSWDVVVASDVLYEKPHADLVAAALARTIARDGHAIIADPGRPALEAFVEACEARGLSVAAPERVPWAEGEQNLVIQLFLITHHHPLVAALRAAAFDR